MKPMLTWRCKRACNVIRIMPILFASLVLNGCDDASDAAGGTSANAIQNGGLTTIPQSLTIGSAQKILSLDPILAADGYSEGIVHLLGGNLYELGRDGKVAPLLAASNSVSSDGLTWTFNLKPGLKFSDGTELTSEDVRATFERAKADDRNVYIGFFDPIKAIDTPRSTEIVIHLKRPYPSLPIILSQPEMTILPTEGLAKGPAFFDAPVSAGQYKLESWGGGTKAVLVRNREYAGAAPSVERLIFVTIDDFNARFAQVQSGELDLATDIPPRMLVNPPNGLVGALTPHYGFVTIPLNVNRAPLDNTGVRRAISKAIDRKQLSDTVWNGKATPIAGFWPSTMTGYDRTTPTSPDIEGARTDLEGTPCQGGCTLRFLYSTANPWAEPTATIVAQNLKAIGITVELEKVDDATFNERLGGIDFQMAVSFLYDYNDVPDGLLVYAMTADGGLSANFTGFQPGSDITDTVGQAINRDGADRSAALARISALFARYQPFVTLSDYAVGSVSRYAPSVVKTNEAGFIDVARETP